MNSIGALMLFAGVGILLFVGLYALDDLHGEVNATNDTEFVVQNEAAQAIENPNFMAFGYGLLLAAALLAVNAIRGV